eukprot:193797_1
MNWNTVWFCKYCNWKNHVNSKKCGSCDSNKIIERQIESRLNRSDTVTEVRYFYHGTDPSKPAKGPFNVEQLRLLYLSEEINDTTYLWNGTTLNKWTSLNKIDHLFSKIRPYSVPFSRRNLRSTTQNTTGLLSMFCRRKFSVGAYAGLLQN